MSELRQWMPREQSAVGSYDKFEAGYGCFRLSIAPGIRPRACVSEAGRRAMPEDRRPQRQLRGERTSSGENTPLDSWGGRAFAFAHIASSF